MTTSTLTLSAFLLARIEEDEARIAAFDGRPVLWPDLEHGESGECNECDARRAHRAADDVFADRVLAECKAKRAIIKLHDQWPVLVESPPTFESVDSSDINSMTFRATRQILWATEQEYRVRFGSEPPTAPMIRALASVYADHPDFNPEWS